MFWLKRLQPDVFASIGANVFTPNAAVETWTWAGFWLLPRLLQTERVSSVSVCLSLSGWRRATGSRCLLPREQRERCRKRPSIPPHFLRSVPLAAVFFFLGRSSPRAARHQYALMMGISCEQLDTDIRQINKMLVPLINGTRQAAVALGAAPFSD